MDETIRGRKSKKNSQLSEIWRRFRKNKAAMLGLALVLVIILVAVLADVITPYGKAIAQVGKERLKEPSALHVFGTDEFGRDLFARVVHGSRYSLLIGISTSVISLIIGGFIGAACGYYGGRLDNIVMRIMDVVMSVPPVLLSLAVVAALGANLRNLLIAITISCVPSTVRLIRSVVISLVDQEYVEAATSYCASDLRIILLYVIPNAMGPIIVNTTMNIAVMILSAAGLSFIGMGVQPPAPEWGRCFLRPGSTCSRRPTFCIFPAAPFWWRPWPSTSSVMACATRWTPS